MKWTKQQVIDIIKDNLDVRDVYLNEHLPNIVEFPLLDDACIRVCINKAYFNQKKNTIYIQNKSSGWDWIFYKYLGELVWNNQLKEILSEYLDMCIMLGLY